MEKEKNYSTFSSRDNTRSPIIERARQFPLLDAQQEVLLFQAYAQERENQNGSTVFDQLKKDPEFQATISEEKQDAFTNAFQLSDSVQNLIANCNLRLVIDIASKTKISALTLEDRTQEGHVGLIKAIEKFDHTQGIKFSTFATHWITNTIKRTVDETDRIIRIPVYLEQVVSKTKRELAKFINEHNRYPSENELSSLTAAAEEDKSGTKQAAQLVLSGALNIDSLNKPMDGDYTQEIGDFIADPDENTNPEHVVVSSMYNGQVAIELAAAFAQLTDRERDIVYKRWFDNVQSDELAKTHGLSPSRIRAIDQEVKEKLRNNQNLINIWEANK